MSSTNKTSNLELSQFIGTDSPKWLSDYNSDMQKIDAGYGTVKSQADATDLVVAGHTSSIQANTQTIGEQQTGISELRTDVTSAQGSINTINELIGNGEPTTSNKTLIGAINELADDISEISGYTIKSTAWHTSVDLGVAGTDTFQDLYDAVIDKIGDILDGMNSNERLIIDSILPEGLGTLTPSERYHYVPSAPHPTIVLFDRIFPGSSQIVIWALRCEKTSPKFEWSRIAAADGTITAGTYAATDLLSSANITSASLKYTIYKPVQ